MYLTAAFLALTFTLALSRFSYALVVDTSQTTSIPGISSVYTASGTSQATQAARYTINNNIGIGQGIPNNAHVDPCGPPATPQAMAAVGTHSTCHRNVSVSPLDQSNYYGVQCQIDNTGYILNQTTCLNAMATICLQISGMQGPLYQTNDKWIWSTWDSNCKFGYWLPGFLATERRHRVSNAAISR